ncbi:MAG TPA: hypothetical protein VGI46_22170 [Candidatus Acidoferrum sp.]|jgi:hypothetical protein
MTTQTSRINIATSLLWAAAIIAAAILKAPTFLTVVLLPLLGFCSLTSVQTIGRQSKSAAGVCL